MIKRRTLLAGAASLAAVGVTVNSCPGEPEPSGYDLAVRQTWRHGAGMNAEKLGLYRELVRYATLAPSSHNSQCWKFKIGDRRISILPDLTRRCPVVDPDDHHLSVSLGCAAENLIQAAQAHGLHADADFAPASGGIEVLLSPTTAAPTPLFDAIPRRQSSRSEYDRRPLAAGTLTTLARAGSGAGIDVLMFTGVAEMEKLLEFVIAANSAQMSDPAFVQELKGWMRFSDDEALESRDGLFARASGNPALPRWLGNVLFKFFYTAAAENQKIAKQLRSSAGVAIFSCKIDDKPHWLEIGRAYQRFALQATALGIRNALINQPVEVASLRQSFASFLGIGGRRPDLVVRFGYGAEMPRSLRRPIDAVLV